MGDLARHGIVNGRKVILHGTFAHGNGRNLVSADPMLNSLHSNGFAEITERIDKRQSLSLEQIEHLLTEATLPVLMKLVEFNRERSGTFQPVRGPRPLVALPLETWLCQGGYQGAGKNIDELLASYSSPDLLVVLEKVDPGRFQDRIESREIGAFITNLVQRHPGLAFVGPGPDELIPWIDEHKTPGDRAQRLNHLEYMLRALRRSGVTRVKPGMSKSHAGLLSTAGFPVVLITPLDKFKSMRELAKELWALNELGKGSPVEVWIPGYSRSRDFSRPMGQADFDVLRLLAVGAICLKAVPVKRASSRFLSLAGLSMARHCGANDLGYGALDDQTQKSLRFQRYHTIRAGLFEPLSQ